MSLQTRFNLSRTGVILSNLSFAALIYGVVAMLSTLVVVLVPLLAILLWVAAIFFTLGLGTFIDGFWEFPEKMLSGIEFINPIMPAIFASSPIAMLAGTVLSIISAILLSFGPTGKKHVARIVVTVLIGAFALVSAIILIVKGVQA